MVGTTCILVDYERERDDVVHEAMIVPVQGIFSNLKTGRGRRSPLNQNAALFFNSFVDSSIHPRSHKCAAS